MVIRLTSVVVLAIVLKGSSCLSSSTWYCCSIVVLVSKIWEKLNGILTWMYVEVAAYRPIFLKKSFGFAKSKFWALMSSGSGSGTVEPELILRRP